MSIKTIKLLAILYDILLVGIGVLLSFLISWLFILIVPVFFAKFKTVCKDEGMECIEITFIWSKFELQ